MRRRNVADEWEREPKRSRKNRPERNWQPAAEEVDLAEAIVPERDLPGSVYMVPDKFWGFSAVGRTEHPGACTACLSEEQVAILLKGRDAVTLRGKAAHWFVDPSPGNGLEKITAFELLPYRFPLRRVLLMHPQRRVGQLAADDLDGMHRALERLFPNIT